MTDRQYCSETINELSAALAKAQGKIKHAQKEVDNSFFKSKYADLSSCVDAARSHLSDNGLSVTQIMDFNETGQWLITQLNHSSGQWIRSYYPVKPVKADPQGLGSAITYARRYAFCAITGVAPAGEDDDGNEASGKKETAGAAKKRFAALKESIETSDDPAATWGDNLAEINGFQAQAQDFYDDLVKAGAKRKQELAQMESVTNGMAPGFSGTRAA